MTRRTLRLAAVLALVLAGGASAQAPAARDEPVLERALRHYRFDPDALDADAHAALARTREALIPDPDGHPLNRTQAMAIVYMALVFPVEQEEPRPGERRRCRGLAAQVYALGNLVEPRTGAGLFVTEPDEQRRIRHAASRIQQEALRCASFPLADRAGEVLSELGRNLPTRSTLGETVVAMKAIVRAGGDGSAAGAR